MVGYTCNKLKCQKKITYQILGQLWPLKTLTVQGKMLGGFNSIRMVRKGLFYGKFAPTLPVSAESAYQTTGIGKSCSYFTVGCSECQPTCQVCQDNPCPQTPDFLDRGILTGKMTFWRDKCIFYCLQVANRLMYQVTTNIPIILLFANFRTPWRRHSSSF